METLSLRLSQREITGKNVKKLRRAGIIPVHYYGAGTSPLSLQVEDRVLQRLLPIAGATIPITVEVEGRDGDNICFVREIQRHPVTEDLLHVDLLRVDVSQTMTGEVPIVFEGVSPAVVDMDGTLIQALNSIRVEALPMNMPASYTVDISVLEDFDKTIRVEVIRAEEGVTILTDPDEMIVTAVPPRIEEEEVPAEEEIEEGVELAEGEEAPEGEEAAEGTEGARGR